MPRFLLPVSYAGVNLFSQTRQSQAESSKQVGQVQETCEKWFKAKRAVNSPESSQSRFLMERSPVRVSGGCCDLPGRAGRLPGEAARTV